MKEVIITLIPDGERFQIINCKVGNEARVKRDVGSGVAVFTEVPKCKPQTELFGLWTVHVEPRLETERKDYAAGEVSCVLCRAHSCSAHQQTS